MTASKSPPQKMLDLLLKLEAEMGDLSESKMPCRRFKLPFTFKSKRQGRAIQRSIETWRPYASYLPDTMDFVAKNNAFTEQVP
jgi:urea carboxylase